MDSLITAAARALAAGDPLGALNRVALRDDAPALALRGIAMAQLGDLDGREDPPAPAARAFGPREAVARRAVRGRRGRDRPRLARPGLARESARRGAGHARSARRPRQRRARAIPRAPAPVLLGRLDEAERPLAELDPSPLPPASRAAYELVVAGIALRRAPDEGGARGPGPGRARRATRPVSRL